jgi:hypothetical protein
VSSHTAPSASSASDAQQGGLQLEKQFNASTLTTTSFSSLLLGSSFRRICFYLLTARTSSPFVHAYPICFLYFSRKPFIIHILQRALPATLTFERIWSQKAKWGGRGGSTPPITRGYPVSTSQPVSASSPPLYPQADRKTRPAAPAHPSPMQPLRNPLPPSAPEAPPSIRPA